MKNVQGSAPVFDCRMCGQCCEGVGGIVVSPTDLQRLCSFMAIDEDVFRSEYGMMHNGKLKVRNGQDGKCIFFEQGKGCKVHEGKPDICRAWPFFRGNMIDPESLFLAKGYCPGIRSDASHQEFVAEGKVCLDLEGLTASDATCEAHALMPPYKELH